MRWTSSLSDAVELERAVRETTEAVRGDLDASPDLVVGFVSNAHRERYHDAAALLASAFEDAVVLGCSAQSVIGDGQELEEVAGFSVTAAVLPDVKLHPFRLDPGTLPEKQLKPELFGIPPGEQTHFLMLADPFTTQTEQLVQCLDAAFPDRVKVGGLASGGTQPGECALFLGDRVAKLGLVGVALSGNIEVEAIVAQGCRPIGHPMFVTRAKDNLVLELDGQPPIELLERLYGRLGPADRALFRNSLFVGLVMREDEMEYGQGDFLIRNLAGLDEESGAIAVAADVSDVRVIQFHMRDASTSAQDLEASLASYAALERQTEPAGALLFSCLGRGRHLYGETNHDSRLFREHLGDIPLGGFFCNGEIGPVRARTYLHGYTSSFGIFRPAR